MVLRQVVVKRTIIGVACGNYVSLYAGGTRLEQMESFGHVPHVESESSKSSRPRLEGSRCTWLNLPMGYRCCTLPLSMAFSADLSQMIVGVAKDPALKSCIPLLWKDLENLALFFDPTPLVASESEHCADISGVAIVGPMENRSVVVTADMGGLINIWSVGSAVDEGRGDGIAEHWHLGQLVAGSRGASRHASLSGITCLTSSRLDDGHCVCAAGCVDGSFFVWLLPSSLASDQNVSQIPAHCFVQDGFCLALTAVCLLSCPSLSAEYPSGIGLITTHKERVSGYVVDLQTPGCVCLMFEPVQGHALGTNGAAYVSLTCVDT